MTLANSASEKLQGCTLLDCPAQREHSDCMGNKGRILVAVLLVVVLGGLAWEVLLPHEPVYEGRPLSAWLHDSDTSIKERLPSEKVRVLMAEKQKKREVAEKAIRHFGTNALPMLIALLSSKDSKERERLFIWSTRQPLSQFRLQGASERRWLANEGFRVLGETAAPALPALIEMLKNRDEVEVPITTDALSAIGSKVFLPVINALTNQDDRVRIGALFALQEIAPLVPTDIIIPALVIRLTDTSPRARSLAAFILGKYESAAKAAIPDLLKALNDPDGNVRIDAAKALKQIDPVAAAEAGAQ
jgi:hypothetical protein